MTKKELRAEIEKLQKAYGLRYYGGINSMKKAELESFLSDIKYAHSLKRLLITINFVNLFVH